MKIFNEGNENYFLEENSITFFFFRVSVSLPIFFHFAFIYLFIVKMLDNFNISNCGG